jgi:GH15 family glucan-1,4-alpha-glucosidase
MPSAQRGADIRRTVLEYLETIWSEPDEGIWEVRGGRWHFTHSKVMAWVAFGRAAMIAEKAGDASTSARWRRIADEIHGDVCRNGFDPELGSFVQFHGSRQLDASLLQIPSSPFSRQAIRACVTRSRRSSAGWCATAGW